MHDLEIFYNTRILSIDPDQRYIPVMIVDDVVVVNFDCIFDRSCAIKGANQLIYLLHKLGIDKRFIFLSEDGAIITLSNAIEIIKNIVNCFNLSSDTCALIGREHITLSNVHVVNKDSVVYWCRLLYKTIRNVPQPSGPFSKKFAVWFHRGEFYRTILAKHLYENYQFDSYISYQEQGILLEKKLEMYFETEIQWSKISTPILYDQLFPNRMYDHNMIVGAERKPYNDYFVEIVAETDILGSSWLTEKTIKNLYIGKAFIVYSGAFSLEKLRSFGFKTFSPWINEEYDNIKNNYLRLEAIKVEIDRLAALSCNEIQKMHEEMLDIHEHNRNIFTSLLRYQG
jgi:hypothetical protein